MSFESFFCDFLELRLRFASGEMDVAAFIKAVTERGIKTDADDDGDRDIAFSFGSPEKNAGYHAHLRVFVKADESGRIELSFHRGPLGDKEERPPYVEDCTSWLGGLIKTDKLPTHLHVNYTFGKPYSPVITLPFPLVTSEKALTGALVTGLGLLLPNEGASKTVILQSAGDETYIFLRVDTEIDLKSFKVFSELEKLSGTVNPLVKKQDNINEPKTSTTE